MQTHLAARNCLGWSQDFLLDIPFETPGFCSSQRSSIYVIEVLLEFDHNSPFVPLKSPKNFCNLILPPYYLIHFICHKSNSSIFGLLFLIILKTILSYLIITLDAAEALLLVEVLRLAAAAVAAAAAAASSCFCSCFAFRMSICFYKLFISYSAFSISTSLLLSTLKISISLAIIETFRLEGYLLLGRGNFLSSYYPKDEGTLFKPV